MYLAQLLKYNLSASTLKALRCSYKLVILLYKCVLYHA